MEKCYFSYEAIRNNVYYIQLTCSYSLAKAKLSFPNLRNTYSFEGDLNALIEQKAYLLRLKQLLMT